MLLLTAITFAQPRVIEAETRQLTFQVSPVPQTGDVAEQVRQGLRGFSGPVVKLLSTATVKPMISEYRAP